MTEAEALDEAAKAAGWGSWEYVKNHCDHSERPGIRAHAKAIMENAALEAKLADISKALMATAEAAASSAKKGMEAEARLAGAREALEENAENARLLSMRAKQMRKALRGELSRLQRKNAALKAENERLREALREVFEEWAGSEDFIPETAPEGYLLQLTKRMADIARTALERIDHGDR